MYRRDSHVHSNRCSSSSPLHHSSQLALLIMSERYSDPAWPPGTVRLQQIFDKGDSTKDANIILQPRPTADPNDPLNWTRKQKILNYSLACYYAMMVFAFVNATSPTWGPMGDELDFSSQTLTNTYAIGCATLALGAPMLIPFALKYGSRPVYLFSSVAQFAISIWAAKTVTAGDWWSGKSSPIHPIHAINPASTGCSRNKPSTDQEQLMHCNVGLELWLRS